MSRITLLDPVAAPPAAREVYERIGTNGAAILNLYRILGHSPAVMQNTLRLGNSLLGRTELPAQCRELAIMRVAVLCGSDYEWSQHYPVALQTGLSEDQLKALRGSDNAPPEIFSERERVVLRYTDELTTNVKVSDDTFARLKQLFDERSILELTASVGYWGMLARVLVGLEVDIDLQVSSLQDLFGKRGRYKIGRGL